MTATPGHRPKTRLKILAGLDEVNARWLSNNRAPLRIGTGFHTGEVVAGFVGTGERKQFDVNGDRVNSAVDNVWVIEKEDSAAGKTKGPLNRHCALFWSISRTELGSKLSPMKTTVKHSSAVPLIVRHLPADEKFSVR